jgi:hypothetical protein
MVLEDALKAAKQPEAGRYTNALLFPKAESALGTTVYSGNRQREQYREKRRISISDFAPAYFRLYSQSGTWGRNEIEQLVREPEQSGRLNLIASRIESAAESERPRLRRLLLD